MNTKMALDALIKRLRTAAYSDDHTDIIADLLEAADALETVQVEPDCERECEDTDVQAGPVGVAGVMPGTPAFTMACFHAETIPVGTKLYTTPQEPAANAQQVEASAEIVQDENGLLTTQWAVPYIPNVGDKLYLAPVAVNAELLAALNNQMAATYALLEWAAEVSDEYLDGQPGLRAELVNDLDKAREHSNQSRAAIAKATREAS